VEYEDELQEKKPTCAGESSVTVTGLIAELVELAVVELADVVEAKMRGRRAPLSVDTLIEEVENHFIMYWILHIQGAVTIENVL
jgi:hypothetical protein